MLASEVHRRLTAILRDVFDDDTLEAEPALTADEVDGWDSFGHIRLIATVEERFGVKFAAAQIFGLKNVGDLTALIVAKTA